MTWVSHSVATGADIAIELDLPPDWWAIRPAEYTRDVAALVAGETAGFSPDSPVPGQLNDELGRLARVSAEAGALLLVGGAAFDQESEKVVTVSGMLLPHDTYLALDRSQHQAGPVERMDLPAAPAMRHLWLGAVETPVGLMLRMEIDYVIAPPQPPSWVLTFATPALAQRVQLAQVFDAIAATVRLRYATPVDVAASFR